MCELQVEINRTNVAHLGWSQGLLNRPEDRKEKCVQFRNQMINIRSCFA